MKVKMAVLGSPSLTGLMVSVDVEQHAKEKTDSLLDKLMERKFSCPDYPLTSWRIKNIRSKIVVTCGPSAWNYLPYSLRHSKLQTSFTHALRRFSFRGAF